MADAQQFRATVLAVGAIALGHALLTWSLPATAALFGGGAVVAFVAEVVVIQLGWLDHHIGPKLLGVPLYVLAGWTGTVYAAYRVALFAVDGWPAVGLAAILATAYDVATDHRGVEDGHWTYNTTLGGPDFRGVPWWNYAGWLTVSAGTAALGHLAL